MYINELSIGFVVGATVVGLINRFFLQGYLTEKGKNLATKEDIAKITDEVESIRAPYSYLLEELRSRHQLRLAALDQRLEAQQRAFALWKQLFNAVHSPQVDEVVMECQDFWNTRCLYLTPEAREAFYDAYRAAAMHSSMVQANRGKGQEATQEVRANFETIRRAGQVIVESINLPPIHGEEANVPGNSSTA